MSGVTDAPAGPGGRGSRLGYMPWMDGMRAIAVLAVLAFHENLVQTSLPIYHVIDGGEFGVDVFFVISGFLITALLLREVGQKGRIGFGAFYLRRARRLLPALFVLLAVLAVTDIGWDHGHARTQGLERILITLCYLTNWVAALTQHQMKELNHTWSLADEEQFYLLWPAILTAVLALARRMANPKVAVAGVGAITALSFAWLQLAIGRHWGHPRIYYALDTHSIGLAIGALLGVLYVQGRLPRSPGWVVVRRLAAVAGALVVAECIHDGGFVARVFGHVLPKWFWVSEDTYVVVALATALVIWELVESAPHIGHRIFGAPPLVAIGRISYAVYLWGAVIDLKLTPVSVGISGWPLVAVHLAVIFGVATASWFFVERHFQTKRRAPVESVAPAA